MFMAAEGEEGEAHPMHLHGYKFYVLYQGYSLKDSKNASLFTPNPVLKDTVNVPGSGMARIRFKADNPGINYN
jgi:FtsP/CotA-like multicopper oxidase with cupredoxin domain